VAPGGKLSPRLAVLSPDSAVALETQLQEFSQPYQRRSEIIHGGARRTTERWYRDAALRSEEASKRALVQYLRAIPQIRRYRLSDRKSLGAWLAWLDRIAQHLRAELRSTKGQAQK
jgi:hypothetical protein